LWALVVVLNGALARAQSTEDVVQRELEAGRFDRALAAVNAALDSTRPPTVKDDARQDLEMLRARVLFELGDYPACERQIRELLARTSSETPWRGDALIHLAQVVSFQGAEAEALRTLDRALAEARSVETRSRVHRLAIAVALRNRDFATVSRHAELLLEQLPDDPYGHFARGIALTKAGEYEAALDELPWGLRLPGARRDAHFEMALARSKKGEPSKALAHLAEILTADPYDEEACYQLARQLLRMRSREAMRTGALVTRYLEALKAASGPSSRDHHLQAGGEAAMAATLRALKWERIGALDRAVPEVYRAEAVGAQKVDVRMVAAELWARLGFLSEASRRLHDLVTTLSAEDDEARESARRALERIQERLRELEEGRSLVDRARAAVAQARWDDAEAPLRALLEAAVAAKDRALLGTAARLLLARNARSAEALAAMVDATRDPSLLVPHVHFLSRLAEVRPSSTQVRRELDAARLRLQGRGD
jgi:tetratricopeptide (TPR) repeat protein